MGVLNTNLAAQLGAGTLAARLWRLTPGQASTRHRHRDQHELYVVLEGTGRMRVEDELLTLAPLSSVHVSPRALRQVFNDTEGEVLWLIIGAPEELEFLQGSQSQMDLSLIYPVDPKQLPNELAGVEWPPKD